MVLYLSHKIEILSFLSIVLVLYIHSGFHEYSHEISGMTFNIYLQDIISGKIGRCAVPLFFSISGYLFFQHIYGIDDVWRKMKRRGGTLLVPYLLACLFLPLFYLFLEMVPGTEKFINSVNFSDNLKRPLWQLLTFLFFDSGTGTPCAFHLWFLRDLIVIVVMSPLLYLIRQSKVNRVLVCLILCGLTQTKLPIVPFYGLFWFMFGSYFLNDFGKIGNKYVITSLFLIISVIELAMPNFIGKFSILQIPIIILGIVSMWAWYDKFVPISFDLSQHNGLCSVCSFTFFVYLYHEPTINVVRKMLVLPFGHSSFGFAFSYLLSPWVFVLLFIPIGVLLKRYLPALYSVIVGGR